MAPSHASALGAFGAPSALSRGFAARLDDAAEGLAALAERVRARRRVVFVEDADGGFTSPAGAARLDGAGVAFAGGATARALRGAHVEFRVSPQRCVFREIELPAAARDFLDGVVRAQIDRLTPWRADEAVFGYAPPVARGADRIALTIAIAKRAPLLALLNLGADSVRVSVARDADAITLLSRDGGATARRARARLVLTAMLALSLLAGLGALAADWTLGASLRADTEALTARLAERRLAFLKHERAGDDPVAQALDARKRANPAAVVVLEALSRAIPDDAYLTDMSIKGDRLEIAGLANDAAALVKRIEQSPHFAHATFAAPTLRSAEERESFRIEAHIAPLNMVTP